MELNIFYQTTVGDIKRQFAEHFSYLKLEVFSRPLPSRNASLMQLRLDDNLLLKQIKTFCLEGVMTFQPSMTMVTFKNLLQDGFGLSVLIFYKSGGQWLEAPQSDNLSLEKQNSIGQAACKQVRVNEATLPL